MHHLLTCSHLLHTWWSLLGARKKEYSNKVKLTSDHQRKCQYPLPSLSIYTDRFFFSGPTQSNFTFKCHSTVQQVLTRRSTAMLFLLSYKAAETKEIVFFSQVKWLKNGEKNIKVHVSCLLPMVFIYPSIVVLNSKTQISLVGITGQNVLSETEPESLHFQLAPWCTAARDRTSFTLRVWMVSVSLKLIK